MSRFYTSVATNLFIKAVLKDKKKRLVYYFENGYLYIVPVQLIMTINNPVLFFVCFVV